MLSAFLDWRTSWWESWEHSTDWYSCLVSDSEHSSTAESWFSLNEPNDVEGISTNEKHETHLKQMRNETDLRVAAGSDKLWCFITWIYPEIVAVRSLST